MNHHGLSRCYGSHTNVCQGRLYWHYRGGKPQAEGDNNTTGSTTTTATTVPSISILKHAEWALEPKPCPTSEEEAAHRLPHPLRRNLPLVNRDWSLLGYLPLRVNARRVNPRGGLTTSTDKGDDSDSRPLVFPMESSGFSKKQHTADLRVLSFPGSSPHYADLSAHNAFSGGLDPSTEVFRVKMTKTFAETLAERVVGAIGKRKPPTKTSTISSSARCTRGPNCLLTNVGIRTFSRAGCSDRESTVWWELEMYNTRSMTKNLMDQLSRVYLQPGHPFTVCKHTLRYCPTSFVRFVAVENGSEGDASQQEAVDEAEFYRRVVNETNGTGILSSLSNSSSMKIADLLPGDLFRVTLHPQFRAELRGPEGIRVVVADVNTSREITSNPRIDHPTTNLLRPKGAVMPDCGGGMHLYERGVRPENTRSFGHMTPSFVRIRDGDYQRIEPELHAGWTKPRPRWEVDTVPAQTLKDLMALKMPRPEGEDDDKTAEHHRDEPIKPERIKALQSLLRCTQDSSQDTQRKSKPQGATKVTDLEADPDVPISILVSRVYGVHHNFAHSLLDEIFPIYRALRQWNLLRKKRRIILFLSQSSRHAELFSLLSKDIFSWTELYEASSSGKLCPEKIHSVKKQILSVKLCFPILLTGWAKQGYYHMGKREDMDFSAWPQFHDYRQKAMGRNLIYAVYLEL